MQFLGVFFLCPVIICMNKSCKQVKALNIFEKVKTALKQLPGQDIIYFGGLAMLGYGLWLFLPWIGFSVAGALLMATAYLMRSK